MKKYIKLVLDELESRLPKNNKEGFLPSQEVVDAIKELKQFLKKK